MNTTTLTALRASIAHHKQNLKAKSPDAVKLGTKSCALCGLFWKGATDGASSCDKDCPVKQRTGRNGCDGSPYEALADAHWLWEHCDDDQSVENRRIFRAAERKEIRFLESLLPKGEK